MGAGILIVVVALAIGIAIGLSQHKKNMALMEDGKLIKRDASFMESAEIFTLQNADFPTVIAALKETSFEGAGVAIKGSAQEGAVIFQAGSSWAAQLVPIKSDPGTYSYMFTFTKWQTYRGMPQNFTEMNITLTALEKMFLKLDPNTKVESRKNKTITSPHFFS